MGDQLIVGRMRPADVVIDDGSISRQHARFFRKDGAVWIEDLGSTNGTFLHGDRIASATRIAPNDELTLGSIPCFFYSRVTPSLDVMTFGQWCGALDQEVRRADKSGMPLTVLMIRGTIDRLREQLRPIDRVARFSSQSMMMFVPDLDRDAVTKLAQVYGRHEIGVAFLGAGINDADALIDAALTSLAKSEA